MLVTSNGPGHGANLIRKYGYTQYRIKANDNSELQGFLPGLFKLYVWQWVVTKNKNWAMVCDIIMYFGWYQRPVDCYASLPILLNNPWRNIRFRHIDIWMKCLRKYPHNGFYILYVILHSWWSSGSQQQIKWTNYLKYLQRYFNFY